MADKQMTSHGGILDALSTLEEKPNKVLLNSHGDMSSNDLGRKLKEYLDPFLSAKGPQSDVRTHRFPIGLREARRQQGPAKIKPQVPASDVRQRQH